MSAPPIPDSDPATLAHAQAHIQQLLTKSPFYSLTIPNIVPVAASSSPSSSSTPAAAPAGRILCHLPILAHHLNSKGSLHGSVTATLVDFIGGVAIACADPARGHDTGVSVDMHISFAGGARAGEVLAVEGTAERVGGSLAFTRAVLRKVEGGALVATASHTKFVRRRGGAAAAVDVGGGKAGEVA